MFYRQINNCSAILAIAIALTLVAGVSRSESPKTIRYNRDVRPILAENCFACHGFDAASRAAGLRLDTSEGAFAELDSGETAIVPGNVEKSQLLSRIESSDHGLVMPPPESKKQLTASQKRMLRSWIEQGAVYEKHWAFEPPSAEAPPVVDSSVSNPIDSFIVEKLKASGLRLSAPAVPEVQLRRLYLDTIGIPPTPEQIDQYLVIARSMRTARIGRQSIACWPARVWRAMGAMVARPGTLRRQQWLFHRCTTSDMAVSRLGDRRIEQ